ncbi:MAG: type II toxin-antitoxin system VapC family toxin [Rhodocyclaceae bacterium]|nr:type II toxin-antitoxin system VapC family toxin [Rhodocyclaceae bacterium]
MRRYLDTSLIVAALVREQGTEAAKTYLLAASDEFLLASRWVVTELSSALALKVRTGTITETEQAAALAMFRRFGATRLRLLDVEAKDFDMASSLCDRIAAPLRTGDALHLAICKRTGARLATFDDGMAKAAQQHGLPCDLLAVCRVRP